MKELRENRKDVLVLDAGDLFFKKFSDPIPENEWKMVMDKAHLFIQSFNLMACDAIGIGDDDLSLGKNFLLELSKKANFPFLSSNILDEESGKLLFHPYLLKEINGLRVGIFSLLSPDLFLGSSDPRRKGLILRPPIETAGNMVKELQSKTDMILLLSHLSYPKDVELAQAVPGIHLIMGGHTGSNLVYPPVIKNTYIFQTAPKGMYGARLDLNFHNHASSFYNSAEKRSWESRLHFIKNRLMAKEISETERGQWRKAQEEAGKALAQLQGKNEFTNIIFPLRDEMKDQSEILKLIEAHKSKYPETEKPVAPSK